MLCFSSSSSSAPYFALALFLPLIRGDGQNSKECEEVCEEAPQVYHRKEAQAQAHETSIQEEEFIIFRYAYIHMYVDIYTCLI